MGEKFPGAILFHGLKNLSTNDVLKWRVDQWHFVWRFRRLLSTALKVTFGLLTITETPPLIKSLIKRNENEVVVNLKPCIKKLGIFSFELYDPMNHCLLEDIKELDPQARTYFDRGTVDFDAPLKYLINQIF